MHRKIILPVAVLLALCSSVGWAQAPATLAPPAPAPQAAPDGKPSEAADDGEPIAKIVHFVDIKTLIFTVTDKHGKFVKDLKPEHFTLLDNNKPPKEVTSFEAQTNLPLRVGLLIDASNSIRERFLFEQQAAEVFLRQIIRERSDQAFIMSFDETPVTTQDFTSDQGLLSAGIQKIRPGGGTAMWDAVYIACRDKLMKEQNKEPMRRAIILVSDGDDNQSRVLRQQAIEMAQKAEVIIYAISTNLSNILDTGDHNLQMLAEATGGRAFFPFKLQKLADAFSDIQGELRSQYSISYKPDNFVPNGGFRAIQITPDNKNLHIRAARGYYAAKR